MGDKVHVQDTKSRRWIEQGVVARKGRHRDYFIELANGKVRWRNRRFLRPVATSSGGEEDSDVEENDKDLTLRRGTRERKRRVRFSL